MRRMVTVALVLAGTLASAGLASADPAPGSAGEPAPRADERGSADDGHHHDAASDDDLDDGRTPQRTPRRYSDGPRRVPVPRGASKARAEALGLGTRECASRLLHQPVDPRWAAAAGRAPSRLLWPVDAGRWVRGFGYVRTTQPDLIHRGIDIAADVGSVVRAAADGIVAYSDNGVRGYGNLVMIVHANGWMTLYAHASRTTVQPGYRVRRGERIALVGATGIARGPHLHFELWQDGRPVDPTPLFDGGPTYVRRIASRAAARGQAPPVGELTEADRVVEPPLPPHPEDVALTSSPGSRAASGPALGSQRGTRSEPPIGSLALVRRITTRAPSPTLLESIGGRRFSTLLFPVRGGTITAPFRSARAPMELAGPAGAAVRAAMDGLVVFADELPELGRSIVVLHRNGWVITYARLGQIAIPPGQHVERGAWIGFLGDRPMVFALHVGGVHRDPGPLLVRPAP